MDCEGACNIFHFLMNYSYNFQNGLIMLMSIWPDIKTFLKNTCTGFSHNYLCKWRKGLSSLDCVIKDMTDLILHSVERFKNPFLFLSYQYMQRNPLNYSYWCEKYWFFFSILRITPYNEFARKRERLIGAMNTHCKLSW